MPTILIVDDEQNLVDLLKGYLNLEGFELPWARTVRPRSTSPVHTNPI